MGKTVVKRLMALVMALLLCVTSIPSMAFAADDAQQAQDEWHLQQFGSDTDKTLPDGYLSPAAEGSGFTLEYGQMKENEGFGSVIVYNAAAETLQDSIWEFKMKVSGIEETSNRYQIGIFPRFVNGKNCDGIAIDTSSAIQHSYQVNGSEGWPGVSNLTGIAFQIGQEYAVKMVTLGNTITMYVDGVKVAETSTRSEITEGRYAVRIWGEGASPYTKKFELYDNSVKELKNSSVDLPGMTVPAENWGTKDLEIPVTLDQEDQIASITNGETELTAGTDYTVQAETIVLAKEYVAAQPGTFSLDIEFEGGMSGTFRVTKYDPAEGAAEYTWEPEDGAESWIKISGSGSYTMEEDGLHLVGENKLLAADAPSMKNGEIELTFELKNDYGRIGFLFRADEEGKWQGILHDDDYSYSTWYCKTSAGTRNRFHGDGTFLFSRAGLADTKLKLRFWGDNNVTMWMDDYMMFEGSVSGLFDDAGIVGVSTESVSDLVLKKVVCRSLPETYLPEDTASSETIQKGNLIVSLAADFPRVIDYTLNGKKLYGSEFKYNYVTINATDYPAAAVLTEKTEERAVYHVTVEKVGVSFDVVYTVEDGNVLDMRISNIDDSSFEVRSIGFPNQPVLSANSVQPGAKLDATVPTDGSSNYNINGLDERHYTIADGKIAYDKEELATLAFITTDELSASLENNVLLNLKEFRLQAYRKEDGTITAGFENNDFMYKGIDGERMYPNDDLYCRVVLTEDTNEDGIMDWQDGANALKTIIQDKINGGDKVADSFIHVGYNFASQVQQPFLKVADNMKRLSNYIDGFDQILVLKGYANEGHDSGHADYDDINTRAGGAEDMQMCADIIEGINSVLGIHINHSEAYPEAKMYNEQVMSTYNAWSWLDQSQNIRRDVDILNGGMDSRLDSMFNKVPGIGFVYVDTYGDDRWAEARLAQNLVGDHDAILGTENKTDFDRFAAWVHWPGIGDSMHRFVYNQQKDVYTASNIFRGGYSRSASFMSWQHNNNIYTMVEQFYTQQLPQKYLMNHDVRKWTSTEAIFEGNVRSTSDSKIYKDGNLIADGTLVFIPWFAEDSETKDPDEAAKIYHWNPNGGESTWTLPVTWQNQSTVKLYKTTQNGKELVSELEVTDGTVTINALAKTPYVLYKGNEEIAEDVTTWSDGSPIEDTSFNSRDFSIWKAESSADTTDHIKITDDSRGIAILTIEGEADGSVSQTMRNLVPGQKYRLSVWAGAENGKTARLTVVTPDGKTVENYTENTPMANHNLDTYAQDKKVQRVWVDFVQPEGQTTAKVILSADASGSSGKATFMETRIVKTDAPELPANYTAWEDFEHVDQGFGIFAPESREEYSHLSETHLPYTQDTINGNWSLKKSSTMRTQPSTARIFPNTEYTLEFASLGSGKVYVESESDGNRILEKSFAAGESTFQFTTDEKEDYIVRIENGSVIDDFKLYYIDDPTPPSIPENVKAEWSGDMSLKVTWDESADEDSSVSGYLVYRDGELLARVTENEYVDTDVAEYTTYTYEIAAVNAGRTESEKSQPVKGYAGTMTTALQPVSAVLEAIDTASVTFNKAVDQESAENPDNYRISDGVKVTAVKLQADGKTAVLTLENMPADQPVVLTVEGVKDASAPQNTSHGDTPLTLSVLARYYKFDEDSTLKAIDFMGCEDGVKTEVTVDENGYSQKAASFAGTSRVQLSPDSLYGAEEWTLSAWIKWNGVSGESQTIMGNGISGVASASGMWFHIRTDGKLWASPWANGSGKDMHSEATIPVGTWTHVAIKFTADEEFVMYINGEEAARLSYPGFPTDIQNKINIGCNINGSSSIIHKFRGSMDELKIWRTALSDEQILAEANRELIPTVLGDRFVADKNGTKDTTVTVDTSGYELKEVSVDGTALDASAYSLKGSTFTLKLETIQTLEDGTHHVTLTLAKDETEQEAGFELEVSAFDRIVDKSELYKYISMAEDLLAEDYTEESWADLQAALETAKDVFERSDADDSDVLEQAQKLEEAIAGLVEKGPAGKAAEAAQAARKAAENAQKAAEEAQAKAETAKADAEAAAEKAETAQVKAEAAQKAAEDTAKQVGADKEVVEQAKKDAQAAAEAAEQAKKDAQSAESLAAAAQAAAETAQSKAEAAAAAAEAAAAAASDSKLGAEEAQRRAEEAQSTAEAACEEAQKACADAAAAQTAAESAKDSASAYAELADSARNAAEAAQRAAEAAQKEAEEARSEVDKLLKDAQAEVDAKLAQAEAALKKAQELRDQLSETLKNSAFQEQRVTVTQAKSTKKKTAKITWSKVEDAEGYVIQYGTKASFKGAKTITVKKGTTVSRTIKKLTSTKTYYVRVKAYRTVNGEKIYTLTSAKKKVRVK